MLTVDASGRASAKLLRSKIRTLNTGWLLEKRKKKKKKNITKYEMQKKTVNQQAYCEEYRQMFNNKLYKM